MKKKFCIKRKPCFLIFLLWLGGAIAMLFPLSFCLADEATSSVTVPAEVEEEAPPPVVGGGMPIKWFNLPRPPIGGFRILINNGAEYTDSNIVTLNLTGGPDTARMAISENRDFEGAVQKSYQSSRDWTLSRGDGKKTIYVKFYTQWGRSSKIVSDSIILDTIAPANVSNFEAIPGDKKVTLKWQNPPDSDFREVKIFRSTKFYPVSPQEGALVYIGEKESFEDENLINGVTYYYTAFIYDRAGNHSSGAIVSATPVAPPVVPPVKPPVEPPVVPTPPEVEKLGLNDFDFWQEGKKLPIIEEKEIKVKEKEPLTVSIDYEKVPEVLETLILTLEKKYKYFSSLLRINREETKYLATLIPPEPGIYPLTLYVLDYKNQTLETISGELIVEEIETPKSSLEKILWYKNFKIWLYILLVITGIVITIYIFRKILSKIEQRSREEET